MGARPQSNAHSGLWLGAAWTFITWGAFHGLMLIRQRQTSRVVRPVYARFRWVGPLSVPLQIIFGFICVAISRVLFRAESLSDALLTFEKNSQWSLRLATPRRKS